MIVAARGVVSVDGADHAIDDAATALALIDARTLAIGHDDGRVDFVALDGGDAPQPISADKTRRTPVASLAAAPTGALAIGYASRIVAVVDPATGAALHGARLHGNVERLRVHALVVYASTDLGDATSIDLADASRPYCDALREVWRDVPVVLESERLVRREPPSSHACAR